METECGVVPPVQLPAVAKDTSVSEDPAEDAPDLACLQIHEHSISNSNGDDYATEIVTHSEYQQQFYQQGMFQEELTETPETNLLAAPSTHVEPMNALVMQETVYGHSVQEEILPNVASETLNMSESFGTSDVTSKDHTVDSIPAQSNLLTDADVDFCIQNNPNVESEQGDIELHVQMPSLQNETITQPGPQTPDLLTQLQEHRDEFNSVSCEISDNNNLDNSQEVLNKDELLNILEGNNTETADTKEITSESDNFTTCSDSRKFAKSLEKEVALNALKQLTSTITIKKKKLGSKIEQSKSTVTIKQRKSNSKVGNISTEKAKPKSPVKRKPVENKSLSKQLFMRKSSSVEKNVMKIGGAVKQKRSSTNEHIKADDTEKTDSRADRSKDLIKVLVEDWEDDEMNDISEETNEMSISQTMESKESEAPAIPNITEKKSEPANEELPKRRVSRVIKKRVPFDPDNPDTFTSKLNSASSIKIKTPQRVGDQSETVTTAKVSSNITKTKQQHSIYEVGQLVTNKIAPSDNQADIHPDTFENVQAKTTSQKTPVTSKSKLPHSVDEQNELSLIKKATRTVKAKLSQSEDQQEPPTKKTKANNTPQNTKDNYLTAKSKSAPPQWKKPPPKTSKLKKKLSEVDRLLMDEGAVNMMYQIEASTENQTPKKKNIKLKAAFIKQLNQNTPEASEKERERKFRERKKEPVKVEVLAKREMRSRASTITSAPASSPARDTYSTQDADASIIIRRHSSSSYSDSCMSPRRLSDIEQVPASTLHIDANNSDAKFNEVFMSTDDEAKKMGLLDKTSCLSLKAKLNSKLSKVLNVKCKQDSKSDTKPRKCKEKKIDEVKNVEPIFDKLKIKYDEMVAEVNILKTERGKNSVYDLQTVQQLTQALHYLEERTDVRVTLLLSTSGELCPGLQMPPAIANQLADAVKELFVALESHSKFVVAGVEGTCVGTGLALLALCDVVLASEQATFRLLANDGQLAPGLAVLTSHRKSLSRSLVTEMLVFGRQLSASEALARGLVSRTLWPDRFACELRAMVRDIAAQPLATLQLKKRLLGLRNELEPQSTFHACLDMERDLLAQYWSSAATDSAIRPNYTDH